MAPAQKREIQAGPVRAPARDRDFRSLRRRLACVVRGASLAWIVLAPAAIALPLEVPKYFVTFDAQMARADVKLCLGGAHCPGRVRSGLAASDALLQRHASLGSGRIRHDLLTVAGQQLACRRVPRIHGRHRRGRGPAL
jgi:hypothetical protein